MPMYSNLAPRGVLLIATLVSILQAPTLFAQSTSADSFDRTQQAQLYDEAVHILGGNANVISRWVGDVRYHLIGSEDFQRQAVATLSEVAALAKLPMVDAVGEPATVEEYMDMLNSTPAISLSACNKGDKDTSSESSSTCANYVILQTSNAVMEEIAVAIPLRKVYQRSFSSSQSKSQAVSCFFAPFVGGRQIIRQVFIYIGEDLSDAMVKTCLQEEIYQSFGLFNDFTDAQYFSFNNKVEPKSITKYDRALFETVYAPDFAPGTPVFRVLKRFMSDLGLDPFGD